MDETTKTNSNKTVQKTSGAKIIERIEKTPTEDSRAFSALVAESLFVLLPLIVLTIIYLHQGKGFRNLLSSPEWSFGGAVFMGQAMVKVVYAIFSGGRGVKIELIALWVAAIIVLGLVPSLIILSIMLTEETPSTTMTTLQLVFFVIGLVIFLLFGTVSRIAELENSSE